MITAFGSIAGAVEAVKSGAVDYLGKPLRSPEELRLLIRRTLDQRRLLRERDTLAEQDAARFCCGEAIASDPAMAAALLLARKVAPTSPLCCSPVKAAPAKSCSPA